MEQDLHNGRNVRRGIRSAVELARLQQSFGLTRGQLCSSFVQQVITYKLDVGEYPRYPIENWPRQEVIARILQSSVQAVLLAMGYEVALLFLPGHCALGIAGARGWKAQLLLATVFNTSTAR